LTKNASLFVVLLYQRRKRKGILAKRSAARQVFDYSSIGLQLAITLLIFVYGGYKLDIRYKTEPLFVVVGVVLGMGIGFYNLFKELSGIEKHEKENKENTEDNTEDNTRRRKWL